MELEITINKYLTIVLGDKLRTDGEDNCMLGYTRDGAAANSCVLIHNNLKLAFVSEDFISELQLLFNTPRGDIFNVVNEYLINHFSINVQYLV